MQSDRLPSRNKKRLSHPLHLSLFFPRHLEIRRRDGRKGEGKEKKNRGEKEGERWMTINFDRGTWPSMVCINGPIRALDIQHPEYPISMDARERERERERRVQG